MKHGIFEDFVDFLCLGAEHIVAAEGFRNIEARIALSNFLEVGANYKRIETTMNDFHRDF